MKRYFLWIGCAIILCGLSFFLFLFFHSLLNEYRALAWKIVGVGILILVSYLLFSKPLDHAQLTGASANQRRVWVAGKWLMITSGVLFITSTLVPRLFAFDPLLVLIFTIPLAFITFLVGLVFLGIGRR